MPFKEGGVGLNVKTARAITEELELVLILGFGISHTLHVPRPFEEGSHSVSGENAENDNNKNTNEQVNDSETNAESEVPDQEAENQEIKNTGNDQEGKPVVESNINKEEGDNIDDKIQGKAIKADAVAVGTDIWPDDDGDNDDEKALEVPEFVVTDNTEENNENKNNLN